MKDIYEFKNKMDADYRIRKAKYDADCEKLRIQREEFYRQNPHFPYPTMFMQVIAPPQKISIEIIE